MPIRGRKSSGPARRSAMSNLAISGGTPVRSAPYPAWPAMDESDAQAVADVVRSGQVGGFPEPGPKAAEFAAAFAAYQGAAHGVVMANGTVTMEVALKALGDGGGRTARLRRCRGRPLDDRLRPAGGGDLAPHARHHAGAPGPADGRHGP